MIRTLKFIVCGIAGVVIGTLVKKLGVSMQKKPTAQEEYWRKVRETEMQPIPHQQGGSVRVPPRPLDESVLWYRDANGRLCPPDQLVRMVHDMIGPADDKELN